MKKLKIVYCSSLVDDVSALGRVPRLLICDCPGLKNIEGLGKGNINLSIANCPKISKVAHLKTVELSGCSEEAMEEARRELSGVVPNLTISL